MREGKTEGGRQRQRETDGGKIREGGRQTHRQEHTHTETENRKKGRGNGERQADIDRVKGGRWVGWWGGQCGGGESGRD